MVSRKRILCLLGLFICVNLILLFSVPSLNFTADEKLTKENTSIPIKNNPRISTGNNYDSIDEILDAKIINYSTYGYFPQVYQPSLQATYYGLYILDEIGRLSTINQTEITNFLMSHYDQSSNIFMDDYSRRYLDIDISKTFYPLSSVLEINCYAILSLSILGMLDLINTQDAINFLWSCYNPSTSGFVGQPYNFILPDHFKLSTMDNTYFAIKTLDLLMSNWNGYLTEKNDLIQYIIGLQDTNSFFWYFGGFLNDQDLALDTLALFEPNLLSSFYSIAALDVFNAVDNININNFHQYLGGLYDSGSDSFQMAYFLPSQNYGNLVGTSLGVFLSDITGYSGIDRSEVLSFILLNRNYKGIWNYSTDYIYSELIDTFQVIRSLAEAGELSQLTALEKDRITSSISLFFMCDGFSLLSQDYTSINLLYSLINAFDINNRLPDLDFQNLYSVIEQSCLYKLIVDCEGFVAGLVFDESYLGYRSFPIEYYLSGDHQYVQEADKILMSHESTFMALDALNRISKLDEFEISHGLDAFISSIIDSQYLEVGYSNYGGFLPFLTFTKGSIPYQNEKIFIDYSYYAIKTLELLSEYLGYGNIVSLAFDVNALSTYIHNKIIDDGAHLYFDPGYSRPEIWIQNTYYAAYILHSVGQFDLDKQKIKNFIQDTINYSNIRSVYYSYKIAKLLANNITLNYDLIYELIGNLYSEENYDYFETTEQKRLNSEIVYWVSDMIENDLKYSTTSIEITSLIDGIFLSTGNNLTFVINSTYGGDYELRINGTLLDSTIFTTGSSTFIYSLDWFTDEIGEYEVYINTTTIEGTTTDITSSFYVFSPSETMVQILTLDNYEFMTTGNLIRFILNSDYPDWYNFTIDGVEISSGGFTDDQIFSISIDGYDMGDHDVFIEARGLDQKEGYTSAVFTVYSTSETIITLHSIDNFLYNSTGNYANFSISSDFPEWYTVEVDGILTEEGPYISEEVILCLLDELESGLHTLNIWANSTDKKETSLNVQFSVFSESFIEIEIRSLDNYEFKTVGNIIRFFLNSSFPDSYEFYVDQILFYSDTYNHSGQEFTHPIDGYFIGEHNITIVANSTDGKEAVCKTSFSVYSLSTTIINVNKIPSYEFMATGNFINFTINSEYLGTYNLTIDGFLVSKDNYTIDDIILIGSDGYPVGDYLVIIEAKSIDGKGAYFETIFSVYSTSSTIVGIGELLDYEFQTTGHIVQFNITSLYPDYYTIFIDGFKIYEDEYISGTYYQHSIDGYEVGVHNLSIWAIGEDGKVGIASGEFTVYSNSTMIINVNKIPSYEFMATGNFINFTISSEYLGIFNLTIDGFLISRDNYTIDDIILISSDGYSVGDHHVIIKAKSIDGKVAYYETVFSVYSTSSTLITIHALDDYLLNSTNNYLNFSIYSKYPDYYELWIDDILISSDNFSKDQYILYSLDYLTSILGNHTVYIYSMGLDGKEAEISDMFEVYEIIEEPDDPTIPEPDPTEPTEHLFLSIMPLGILVLIPGTIIFYSYKFENKKNTK